MRGFTLEKEEEEEVNEKQSMVLRESKVEDEEKSWCPFEYEYVPDFCYTCGILGHNEKECSIKLKKGETPQYGRWLRANMGNEEIMRRIVCRDRVEGAVVGLGTIVLGDRVVDLTVIAWPGGRTQSQMRGVRREGREETQKREGAGGVHVRGVQVEKGVAEKKGSERKEGNKYKRANREKGGMRNEGKREEVLGHKRSKIEEDVEETTNKKGRREEAVEVKEENNTTTSAGLQEQPRREQ
ncbi:retrotransposon protein [Hordeum vulgare]|nr:retrotransposon protein [Hordeum vulgare]